MSFDDDDDDDKDQPNLVEAAETGDWRLEAKACPLMCFHLSNYS